MLQGLHLKFDVIGGSNPPHHFDDGRQVVRHERL